MPTSKARINVSIAHNVNIALQKLAHRDQIPTATKAERLLELALEIEEDDVFNEIADTRQNKPSAYIDHNKAWK